jgi:hypothetical protein
MNSLPAEEARYKMGNRGYCSKFYDKYAGAMYGIILRAVNNEIIADKVFVKVFKNAFVKRDIETPKFLSEFTCVSNHARKISQETIRAINLFKACNEGRQCVSNFKK